MCLSKALLKGKIIVVQKTVYLGPFILFSCCETIPTMVPKMNFYAKKKVKCCQRWNSMAVIPGIETQIVGMMFPHQQYSLKAFSQIFVTAIMAEIVSRLGGGGGLDVCAVRFLFHYYFLPSKHAYRALIFTCTMDKSLNLNIFDL